MRQRILKMVRQVQYSVCARSGFQWLFVNQGTKLNSNLVIWEKSCVSLQIYDKTFYFNDTYANSSAVCACMCFENIWARWLTREKKCYRQGQRVTTFACRLLLVPPLPPPPLSFSFASSRTLHSALQLLTAHIRILTSSKFTEPYFIMCDIRIYILYFY